MDNITTLNCNWNWPSNYKGIEYFRNLETLNIKSGDPRVNGQQNGSVTGLKIDLSKNTKLTSLTFNGTKRLEYLDISNTQLTTITMPTDNTNYTYLKTFKAANTQLTTVNLSSFRNIETIDVRNSANLTSLTLPTATNGLKKLYIEGSGISSLNLSDYTNLAEVTFDNTKLTPGTDLIVPTYLDGVETKGTVTRLFNAAAITELTIDVTDESEKAVDVSAYTSLRKLTLIGATDVTLASGRTTFEIDVTQSPNITELDFSDQTSLTTLTVRGAVDVTLGDQSALTLLTLEGVTGLTVGAFSNTSLVIDGTGSPDLVVDLGTQESLLTLQLINMNQIDISGCSALQTLTCQGLEWGDLTEGHLGLICNTGATETNSTLPALTRLRATESGVRKIDLTNAAMNISKIAVTKSLIRELYVPNHLTLRAISNSFDEYYWNNNNYYNGYLYLGYSSISSEIYDGYWQTSAATNRLEILDISGCSNISGDVKLTSTELNYNKSPLKKVYAKGCSQITKLLCYNTDLTELDVRDCSAMQGLMVDQSYLTTVNLSGCSSLERFLGKRCRFENLDFLTVPYEDGTRTAEDIAKLTNIQANGGAYATQIKDENGDVKVLIPIVYTNKLKKVDTRYLGANLQTFMVADNLLETLNMHEGLTGLQSFQCENNMLLTLDLSHLPTANLTNGSKWGWNMAEGVMQVGFLNVEVVKGYAEDGSDDWIAMHLPNGGGYEHLLDNTVGLYNSIEDANAGTNEIAEEAVPFMGTVEDLNDKLYSETGVEGSVCPTGYSGEHLFLHSMTDIKKDDGWEWDEDNKTWKEKGSVLDHDLYDKVLTYRYNTQFNGGQPLESVGLDPHIEIRAHIWPYILNINPATKNSTGNPTGTDYYSSTIMLDYDAVIPNDVKVYVVSGFQEGFKEANQPNDPYDAQLVLTEIGGPGEVLPANTPVIVRSDKAAGLYDFQTAWDFDYKGWEDYRQEFVKNAYAAEIGVDPSTLVPILHGVNEENIIYQEDYDPANYPEKWVNLKNGGANATAIANNLLRGTTEEMTVASKSILTLGRQKNATTYNEETGEYEASYKLGFWKYKATTLPAHRCYITVEDMRAALNKANINDAKEGGAFLFDGNATGIQSVAVEKEQKGRVVYDLQGRRVTGKPTPGIYIINGKKVLVR